MRSWRVRWPAGKRFRGRVRSRRVSLPLFVIWHSPHVASRRVSSEIVSSLPRRRTLQRHVCRAASLRSPPVHQRLAATRCVGMCVERRRLDPSRGSSTPRRCVLQRHARRAATRQSPPVHQRLTAPPRIGTCAKRRRLDPSPFRQHRERATPPDFRRSGARGLPSSSPGFSRHRARTVASAPKHRRTPCPTRLSRFVTDAAPSPESR